MQLIQTNLANATALIEDDIIAIACDDTLIKKTGKKFLGVSWQRDSLSPPWRVNFSWGFRFIQASILLPLNDRKEFKPCRAIPVQLEKLPKHKNPGKRAPQEAHHENYRFLYSVKEGSSILKQALLLKSLGRMRQINIAMRLSTMVVIDVIFVVKRFCA